VPGIGSFCRAAPLQRFARRVVNGVMRPSELCRAHAAASVVLLASLAACARPVLYYPAPAGTPVVAPANHNAPAAPDPTQARSASAATAYPDATAASLGVSSDADYLMARHILVPVAGADMSKVEDSFSEPRDGDRVHRAIDILAPRGTPILAADGGKILRMNTSPLGGICMYTVGPLGRLVYYYAHMDRYNDAMTPGRIIQRGDTLGYVGTTGNAPKDTPHLHFQVMRWPADNKYWNGEPIDPFGALGGVPRAAHATHHASRSPED
jgi:hypothetical protein